MGGASVIVTGVLLKVDSKCLVEISDLSEDECIMKPVVIAPTPVSRPTTLVTTEPTLSGQDDPQSLTIILSVIYRSLYDSFRCYHCHHCNHNCCSCIKEPSSRIRPQKLCKNVCDYIITII